MISRFSIGSIIWIMLALAVMMLESNAASDKVRLQDMRTITLNKGKMTTGRRSSPQPQLKCVGGSAKGAYQHHPRSVQCKNEGFDGHDVQWRCDAQLSEDVEFGAINVNCEGYDYPEDPYVLYGSCGLEYELEYTSKSGNRGVSRTSSEDGYNTFATFVVIIFIIYVIYSMFFSRSNSPNAAGYHPGGPGGPGGSPGGPGGPGGYPSAPPPPYDDNSYSKPPPYGFRGNDGSSCGGGANQGTSGANGGGNGFWSGATWGALGGYLASSYLNSGYTRPRRSFFSDNSYNSYSSSSDSYYSGPSTSTRTSSGFGGTTRR